MVLGSVFWGTLSDRVGVRRLYLLLLLLDAVFFFLSAIAESALELLIWRAGAGFCSLMPLAASWISAATPPEKQMKAFTLLTVFILLGFISGSVLGGLLGSVQSGVGVGDGVDRRRCVGRFGRRSDSASVTKVRLLHTRSYRL